MWDNKRPIWACARPMLDDAGPGSVNCRSQHGTCFGHRFCALFASPRGEALSSSATLWRETLSKGGGTLRRHTMLRHDGASRRALRMIDPALTLRFRGSHCVRGVASAAANARRRPVVFACRPRTCGGRPRSGTCRHVGSSAVRRGTCTLQVPQIE